MPTYPVLHADDGGVEPRAAREVRRARQDLQKEEATIDVCVES